MKQFYCHEQLSMNIENLSVQEIDALCSKLSNILAKSEQKKFHKAMKKLQKHYDAELKSVSKLRKIASHEGSVVNHIIDESDLPDPDDI